MFLRVLSNTIQLLIIFIFCLRIEYLNDKFGKTKNTWNNNQG